MREIILVKYGEMALKGANRSTFEDVLLRNIRYRLVFQNPSGIPLFLERQIPAAEPHKAHGHQPQHA